MQREARREWLLVEKKKTLRRGTRKSTEEVREALKMWRWATFFMI